MLEDTDGDSILYYDVLFITPDIVGHEFTLSFTYELKQHNQNNLPPNFFLTLISENWWHSEFEIPVSFNGFKLPKNFLLLLPFWRILVFQHQSLAMMIFPMYLNLKLSTRFRARSSSLSTIRMTRSL